MIDLHPCINAADLPNLRDVEGDGTRLIGSIHLFGVAHSINLIRVAEDGEGVQRGVTPANEEDLDNLNGLYPTKYKTV